MTDQQLAALTAMNKKTENKESKTIDYKVSIANKNKEIKSVGIFKVWKRFSDVQMEQIVAVLGGNKRVSIELLTGETATSDDEF